MCHSILVSMLDRYAQRGAAGKWGGLTPPLLFRAISVTRADPLTFWG